MQRVAKTNHAPLSKLRRGGQGSKAESLFYKDRSLEKLGCWPEANDILSAFGAKIDLAELGDRTPTEMSDGVLERLKQRYQEKEDMVGADVMRLTERIVMLQVIDNQWNDHLLSMDERKQGTGNLRFLCLAGVFACALNANVSSCANRSTSPVTGSDGTLYTQFVCSLYNDASSYNIDLLSLETQGGALIRAMLSGPVTLSLLTAIPTCCPTIIPACMTRVAGLRFSFFKATYTAATAATCSPYTGRVRSRTHLSFRVSIRTSLISTVGSRIRTSLCNPPRPKPCTRPAALAAAASITFSLPSPGIPCRC